MKRVSGLSGAALVLALSCATPSVGPPPVLKEQPLRISQQVLRNGLQLIFEEDTGSQLVSVALTVGAGSHDDPRGREGLAHFVEHLAFRAPMKNGFTVRETLEYAGAGAYNGETDADTTTYLASAPREALPALLAVVAQQLTGPLEVDPTVFDVERKVVEAELNSGADTSHGALESWLLGAVYPAEHLASRSTIGTEGSLRSITAADVAAFRAGHYRPSNATLAVTGGVAAGELVSAITQAFAPVPEPIAHEALAHPVELPPEPPAQRLRLHQAAAADDELFVLWSIPSRFSHPLLGSFLGVQLEQWIGWIAREEHAIKSVRVWQREGLHGAQLGCRLVLREGTDPDRIFAVVTSRLETDISTHHPSTTRRPVRRSQHHTVSMASLERAQERALQAELWGITTLNNEQLEPLSEADVAGEYRWLAASRARAVSIQRGAVALVTERPESTVRALTPERATSVAFAPAAVARAALKLGTESAELEQLENGLQVVVLATKHYPQASAVLLLPGGTGLATPPGSAELGSWLGTRSEAFPGYSPYVAAQGYRARSFEGKDELAYVHQGPVENLPQMLAGLRKYLAGSWSVDSSVLHEVRYRVDPELEALVKEPLVQAGRRFEEAVWQGHPYGHVLMQKEFDDPSAWEIQRWLQRVYSPGQAVLVVVGDVTAELTFAEVRRQFGSVDRRGAPIAVPAPPAPKRHGARYLVTPMQGMTRVGLKWACVGSSSGPRQKAIGELVASWVETQLTRRLREERGLTYSSQADTATYWGGTAELGAALEVNASDLPLALRTLHEVLGAEGIERPQLLAAAWDTLRARNLRYENGRGLALDLGRATREGWPTSALDEVGSTMTTVSVAEFKQALATCREAEVFSLVGDPAVIEAGVSATHLPGIVLERPKD